MKFHNTLQETNRPRRPPPSEYHRERRKRSDSRNRHRKENPRYVCNSIFNSIGQK